MMSDMTEVQSLVVKWFPMMKDVGVFATLIIFIVVAVYKIAPYLLGYAEKKMAQNLREREGMRTRIDQLENELAEWRKEYYDLKNETIDEKLATLERKQKELDNLRQAQESGKVDPQD